MLGLWYTSPVCAVGLDRWRGSGGNGVWQYIWQGMLITVHLLSDGLVGLELKLRVALGGTAGTLIV